MTLTLMKWLKGPSWHLEDKDLFYNLFFFWNPPSKKKQIKHVLAKPLTLRENGVGVREFRWVADIYKIFFQEKEQRSRT